MSEPMRDWTNGEWLDAPGLVAWLEQSGHLRGTYTTRGDTLSRRLHRWRHETRAVSVWVADTTLVELGVFLFEIPAELWIERPVYGDRRQLAAVAA